MMQTAPGTQVTATLTGQIQGGNLATSMLLVAAGREYGLDLRGGVTITDSDAVLGGRATVTIRGTVVSAGPETAEVLYDPAAELTVRIPHGLLEAA